MVSMLSRYWPNAIGGEEAYANEAHNAIKGSVSFTVKADDLKSQTATDFLHQQQTLNLTQLTVNNSVNI